MFWRSRCLPNVVRASELEPFDFGDLAIADHTAGHGTSSSIAVINVPAGAEHPTAYSDASDKYDLVLSGAVAFHTGGEEVTLAPLDCSSSLAGATETA